MPRIVTLPGDGIGPEVTAAAVEVLNAVRDDLEFEEHLIGGASIDAHGTPLTDETLEACRRADAVLLAAVGGLIILAAQRVALPWRRVAPA